MVYDEVEGGVNSGVCVCLCVYFLFFIILGLVYQLHHYSLCMCGL